ncbi:retrovirus-related pol polyprotein from transposon TNT 1-94 [Tanacetum coccineum]
MSENEDRYHDNILDLEAKLKKNVDLMLKLGNSLQGMFMLILYLASSLSNSEIPLNVRDTEDTLDDASKKLSAEQKYFSSSFIPSDKTSNATSSIPASMPTSLKHEVEISVLLNHECEDNSLHAELEQVKKNSIEIQEGLQAKIKILEKDVQRCQKQMQSLMKEQDNVKIKYQKLFDSIKKTRSQSQKEIDELIAHVSEKTYAYGAIRAENQNLLSTISELKTRLETVEKGMNVASSVRRPMNRDSHVKNSVLANSKNSAKAK